MDNKTGGERVVGWLIPVSPNGKPEVTSAMKAEHHGKHSFTKWSLCPKCALRLDQHYDGIECLCNESEDHTYMEKIEVPWDTCKEIYKGMAETAMLAEWEKRNG